MRSCPALLPSPERKMPGSRWAAGTGAIYALSWFWVRNDIKEQFTQPEQEA